MTPFACIACGSPFAHDHGELCSACAAEAQGEWERIGAALAAADVWGSGKWFEDEGDAE